MRSFLLNEMYPVKVTDKLTVFFLPITILLLLVKAASRFWANTNYTKHTTRPFRPSILAWRPLVSPCRHSTVVALKIREKYLSLVCKHFRNGPFYYDAVANQRNAVHEVFPRFYPYIASLVLCISRLFQIVPNPFLTGRSPCFIGIFDHLHTLRWIYFFFL